MRDFELERFFAKWEFSAKYHLTASDAQSMRMDELLSFASEKQREDFQSMWLGYTETEGAPDLREAIAGCYDTLSAKHIQCFAGAEEGLYIAMRCLLQPEDHVIVTTPNYQAAETLPLQLCEVSGLPLRPELDWQFDMAELEALIRPNTKLISVNFPNNPTGAVLSQDRWTELFKLCDKHGIWVFSDEVYRGLELDEAKRLPQAADAYHRALSLNVMSKSYGLPGLRIGWIACQDTAMLDQLNRYKHFLSICNSGPSERLALIALEAREQIWARNRTLLSKNLDMLDAFFAKHTDRFQWQRPDGGCVGFPRYLGGDANDFCETLVDEFGVLLLPPKIYTSELINQPQDRFRIGFGREGLAQGLEVFGQFLQAS